MTPSVTALPPITLSAAESRQLHRLAEAAAETFPRTAEFLAREIDRARIVQPGELPQGLVRMGSRVRFRDDTTAQVRAVTLVYPDEADADARKISVLTPVGAALIGLSVGHSIEWQTPDGGWRSLTVLETQDPES